MHMVPPDIFPQMHHMDPDIGDRLLPIKLMYQKSPNHAIYMVSRKIEATLPTIVGPTADELPRPIIYLQSHNSFEYKQATNRKA
jgi:hypothetical protein